MIGVLFATEEEARPLLEKGHTERLGTAPFVVYRTIKPLKPYF